MKAMARLPKTERILEVSMLASLGLLLAALGVVTLGRLASGVERGRRQRKGSPAEGVVPGERHEHVGAVSAR
jgi:hypothetical protein